MIRIPLLNAVALIVAAFVIGTIFGSAMYPAAASTAPKAPAAATQSAYPLYGCTVDPEAPSVDEPKDCVSPRP